MINSKITTDIMTTTGFKIDIPPAKVVINNQEITDLETFNKVVDSIKEKDKEIERLNNIINELEKLIDSYELGKYDYEIPVVILKDKLKELKGDKDKRSNQWKK